MVERMCILTQIICQGLLLLSLGYDIAVHFAKCKDQLLPGSDYEKNAISDKDIPIIMWWTGRLYQRHKTSLLHVNCPNSVCLTTKNRKYMKDKRTRGIIFYGTDIEVEDMPLPRHPRHEWALFHEESPMNNYMLVHGTTLSLFNHTATFRRESDFPLTSQHLLSLEYLTDRKPISVEKKNMLRKNGLAAVAYIQSHCNVASDRDRYVKELMKHIDIDSYGKCGNNKEIPHFLNDPVESMHSDQFLDFISQYKFVLSLENAICKDYMTEKLFRTLHVGSVPIYRGSPYVKDWIPDDNSIILVDDFNTAQQLAEYIISLDNDDEKYNSYLYYKSHGISNTVLQHEIQNRPWSTLGVIPHALSDLPKPDMLNSFECYICDEISKHGNHNNVQPNNMQWKPVESKMATASHLNCPQPYTSVGDPEILTSDDGWLQAGWIDDYWTGLDKGQALRRMIMAKEKDSSKFQKYWNEVSTENPRFRP